MRALAALVALSLLGLATPASGVAADREKWDTRVFAMVEEPGFPAYANVGRNGRLYAGTYTNPQGDSTRSLVREWRADGTLQRTWTVPGQDLSVDHGVQVANADRRGRLVLLEKSKARVMTLSTRTGRFHTWARLPDLPTCDSGETPCSPNAVDAPAIPNYATWGPRGALFVTDYAQAVIWKITRRTQQPKVWFTSAQLDGSDFGTTGIVYRPRQHDFLISQQTTSDGSADPASGKLLQLELRKKGPGPISTLWTSQPTDLPDGFGIGRSGHIYIAMVGLTQQLVEISPTGQELDRFPDVPIAGENGSRIPFDSPSNATFHGTTVLVANQSAVQGDASHHAILRVEVGERGRTPYLPRTATFRAGRTGG